MQAKKLFLALSLVVAGNGSMQARGEIGAALVGVASGALCEQLIQRAPWWASTTGALAVLATQYAVLILTNRHAEVEKLHDSDLRAKTIRTNNLISYSMAAGPAATAYSIEEIQSQKKVKKGKNIQNVSTPIVAH